MPLIQLLLRSFHFSTFTFLPSCFLYLGITLTTLPLLPWGWFTSAYSIQDVQGCLKRSDLEKLILSKDLMLHLQIIVFMIVHGVMLASCLYSLTNQCSCEISAPALLLKRAPAKHNWSLSSSQILLIFFFIFTSWNFSSLLLPLKWISCLSRLS